MSKLKVASDNRKKQPKKLPSENYKVKTVSKPKYLKIKDTKVLNPSDIKLLDFKGYLVFGDPQVKNATLLAETLEQCKNNNEIIVLLKTTKQKNGSTVYAFSEKVDIVRSYRKMRLANANHLQIIGEATNQPHQTAQEFIKSEFESDLEGNELEAAYILSNNSDLIEKDIKRLIHLMHQQYVQDRTGVSRKDTKLSIAKD